MKRRAYPIIGVAAAGSMAATFWLGNTIIASSAYLQPLPRVAASTSESAQTPAPGEVPAAPVEGSRPVDPSINSLIAAAIPSRIKHKIMGDGYSIRVIDGVNGEQIYAENENITRMPASTMKLVTAFTALKSMGPDKRMTTQVVHLGGTDVALVGGGDSTLDSRDIENLAHQTEAALDEKGLIRRCTQRQLKDDECEPTRINVHYVDNLFGSSSTADMGPGWMRQYVPSVVSSVSSLSVLGSYTSNPAETAARALAANLNTGRTVGVVSSPTGRADGPALAKHVGDPMHEQVAWMLQHSDNNVAETLFRQVAISAGEPATWEGGTRAAMKLLSEAGLPTEGLVIKDGSGLSRENRLSTALEVAILQQSLARGTDFSSIYTEGLPVAGKTGTLGSRYTTKQSKCAQGKVRAKTGTLHDVIALAGVARGQDGSPKLFSIMINAPKNMNTWPMRDAVDNISAALTGC